MLVIGGYNSNTSNTDCDVPAMWGMHNLNLGEQNVQYASWYRFLPNVTSYTVPKAVIDSIGGEQVLPAAAYRVVG